MGKSYKKHHYIWKIWGSEKKDKKFANRWIRVKNKNLLKRNLRINNLESNFDIDKKIISNRCFTKDWKFYFAKFAWKQYNSAPKNTIERKVEEKSNLILFNYFKRK